MHGPWDGRTGQNAPLLPSSKDISFDNRQLNVVSIFSENHYSDLYIFFFKCFKIVYSLLTGLPIFSKPPFKDGSMLVQSRAK